MILQANYGNSIIAWDICMEPLWEHALYLGIERIYTLDDRCRKTMCYRVSWNANI